jgi:hypothetical protein
MPASKYSEFIEKQLRDATTWTDDELRGRALLQYLEASLFECGEKTIDAEMESINGTPYQSPIEDRKDSSYFAYNTARRHAYHGFTNPQKQVLRGLVQHTAFDLVERIVERLLEISKTEAAIRLQPKGAADFEYVLGAHHPRDSDFMEDDSLPDQLSKYEH